MEKHFLAYHPPCLVRLGKYFTQGWIWDGLANGSAQQIGLGQVQRDTGSRVAQQDIVVFINDNDRRLSLSQNCL